MPQSTSGIFLAETVFPKLGVAERIKVKMYERGAQSAAAVVTGEADLAVQPVSELLSVPGIDFVGRIAGELQLIQMFSAAIVKGSKRPDAAKRLIQFLGSERAESAIRKNGMEPATK